MAWYGEDGTKGTISATNGSPTIAGTSTLWLANKAVPSDLAGYGILAPLTSAAILYGIESVTGDGTMTLSRNFAGTTASGLTYAIVPIGGPIVDLLNDISTLLNSSSYAALNAAVSGASNGDFLQMLSGAFTNRSVIQTLLALFSGLTEVNVASATNTDIGAATSPKISITGTTTIASLNPSSGTMTPNAARWARFTGALTLTNGANLILPGGANITTAAGDTALFMSDATATPIWRCMFYHRASGQPIATALSVASLAVAGNATITSNANVGLVGSLNNNDAGAGSFTAWRCNNGTKIADLALYGTGASAYGAIGAGQAAIYTTATALVLTSDVSGGVVKFAPGASSPEKGRVDATGILMGTTARVGTEKSNFSNTGSAATLLLAGDTVTAQVLQIHNAAAASDNQFVHFYTEASPTDRGSIYYNRVGGLTAYGTTSSAFLKMNGKPLDPAHVKETIAAARMLRGDWIDGRGEYWIGGYAHKMGELVPHGYKKSSTPHLAPHEPGYDPENFDYSTWVPYLIAEAQRAQKSEADALKRLAAIEARLTAAGA